MRLPIFYLLILSFVLIVRTQLAANISNSTTTVDTSTAISNFNINIPFCLKIHRGVCFRCQKDYGLNEEGTLCIKNSNYVENCFRYENFVYSLSGVTYSELRCKICTLGHGTYIYDVQSRTYCTNNQFANRVQNCQAYDINLKCIKCKNSLDYDYGKFDFGLGVEINE
jgi:hypothetical protein